MNSSKKTAMYFMYIVDVVTLIISFCMAYLVKFNWIEGENNIHRSDYIILFLLISIMYILINLIFMKNIDFINRNIVLLYANIFNGDSCTCYLRHSHLPYFL